MNRSVCMLKNVHINFTVVKEHRNLIGICVVILRLKTLHILKEDKGVL
jgi:hypothetical protein